MKVAIMQPYFFPYIGYFQLIAAADKFIIYDDVKFINRGWINRNNILINSKASLISIPLSGASQNKLIKDIVTIKDNKWRQTLLKSIEQHYKKAPKYSTIFNILEYVINSDKTNISSFNFLGIKSICEYLNITTKITQSSTIYENNELKGQYRILDICKKENASHYLNPIGGIELYRQDLFLNEGISLSFLKSDLPIYKQFNENFIAGLSIIDVLMFCEPEFIKDNLLKEYKLI